MKALTAVLICLSLSVLAYPQGNCKRCKPLQGCQSNVSGGCECDDGGQTCSSCGFCGSLGCVQPCPFLLSDPHGITESLWYNAPALSADISAHSYTFGIIWRDLHERMMRTGKQWMKDGYVRTLDNKTACAWHAFHASGTQYASIQLDGVPLPPDKVDSPNRLVLDHDKWTLYRDSKWLGFIPRHEVMATNSYH